MTYREWEEKLEAIVSYLESLFPQWLIEKIDDPLRCQLFRKHIFCLKHRDGEIEHFLSIDYDYLHRSAPDEIIDLFEKRNLKNVLGEVGRKEVIMTDDGTRVVPRKKM